MKIVLTTIFISFLSFMGYSQETKFILKKHTEYTEEFYVLKGDKKIKHGTYVKYKGSGISISPSFSLVNPEIHLLATGEYKSGLKSGLWEYYYDDDYNNNFGGLARNSIKERGTYVNGMKNGIWTTYYIDTIPEITHVEKYPGKKTLDSINVSITQNAAKLQSAGMFLNDKRVGEWISFDYNGDEYQRYDFSKQRLIKDKSIKDTLDHNKNRNVLFIGGLPCLTHFLLGQIQLGEVLSEMKEDSISVILSFTINTEGKVFQPKIQKSNAPKLFADELVRLVNLTNNNWISSVLNHEKIDSDYKLRFFLVRKRESAKEFFEIGFKPIFN